MNYNKVKNALVERLNNLLYGSKLKVLNSLAAVKVVISIASLVLLIYGYGFRLDNHDMDRVFLGLDIIFISIVLVFFVNILYSFRRVEYIKNNLFEAVLVGIVLLNGLSNYLFNNFLIRSIYTWAGFTDYDAFYLVFAGIYLIFLLLFDFAKIGNAISGFKLKPAAIFVLSFIILVFIGAGILMLPAMTRQAGSMPFLEALFTSVSACCVTGLIVVDTATYFTIKGQLVIMMLIQIGGLGIVSFASFFASFMKQGVGLKQQLMLQDFLSTDNIFSVKKQLKQIIFITILVEGLTFIGIFLTWGPEAKFVGLGQKVFFSLFHSISAFCNAGFSLYTNGLYEPVVRTAYILHIVVVGAVILGGIGFSSIQDFFSPSSLRERMRSPWKNWKLSTQIAIYTSAALLALGTIAFFLLEHNNTLKSLNFLEALITSFFQSGIARTAGFNTVDISILKAPTIILMIFLMFVGASSGSMGGGIKTSTFYLIIASAFATIRGRQKIEIGKRFIAKELLFKALSIFFFAASLNILCIFFLTISDPDINVLALAFEQVSAFGTVGLSTGITPLLSDAGKLIIILSMFIGRVGTLTFVLALGTRTTSSSYQYPKVHLMVG